MIKVSILFYKIQGMRPLMKKLSSWLLFFMLPFQLFSGLRDQAVVNEFIISPNLEDYDCHGSSIIESSPGILCAVWKGGFGKGRSNVDMENDVGFWCASFQDGIWSEPKQIVRSPKSVCWTPVLFKTPEDKILLFYRVGKDPRHTISLFKFSNDGGKNWSAEDILPAGIAGPTKTKPLLDSEGNLICGSSVESGSPADDFKATACWIEIFSKQKWAKYGPIEIPGKRFGCIEPALFWGKDGNLKMLCRDRSFKLGEEGWIWLSESKDGGKNWSELKKTTLPNPDSSIDALTLSDGNVLVIYNHSHSNRYPLTLALSQDDGQSWVKLLDIEESSGEVPSATFDTDGYLHVTYAWSFPGKLQRVIKHVVIDVKKLL